jgi:hypothetical protein
MGVRAKRAQHNIVPCQRQRSLGSGIGFFPFAILLGRSSVDMSGEGLVDVSDNFVRLFVDDPLIVAVANSIHRPLNMVHPAGFLKQRIVFGELANPALSPELKY